MLCIDPVLGLLLLVVIPCNDLLHVAHCATVCGASKGSLNHRLHSKCTFLD